MQNDQSMILGKLGPGHFSLPNWGEDLEELDDDLGQVGRAGKGRLRE